MFVRPATNAELREQFRFKAHSYTCSNKWTFIRWAQHRAALDLSVCFRTEISCVLSTSAWLASEWDLYVYDICTYIRHLTFLRNSGYGHMLNVLPKYSEEGIVSMCIYSIYARTQINKTYSVLWNHCAIEILFSFSHVDAQNSARTKWGHQPIWFNVLNNVYCLYPWNCLSLKVWVRHIYIQSFIPDSLGIFARFLTCWIGN